VPTPKTKERVYLLIARKNGSSSSRRQRAFGQRADVDPAIERWRAEGFNTWWLYGAKAGTDPRPLLKHWTDDTPPTRYVINEDDDQREPRHPLTDEPTNAARAARLDAAIRAYADQHYGNPADRADHETVVKDFLTDVCHWIGQHDELDANDLFVRALDMYQQELALEKGEYFNE
jgi:hypothetical protein